MKGHQVADRREDIEKRNSQSRNMLIQTEPRQKVHYTTAPTPLHT